MSTSDKAEKFKAWLDANLPEDALIRATEEIIQRWRDNPPNNLGDRPDAEWNFKRNPRGWQ